VNRTLLAAASMLVAYGLGNALAADLGTRAPVYKAPPPVAAPYSWSGVYVGANIGGAWSSDWSSTAVPVPSEVFVGFPPMSFSNGASSVIGGGQIGYNWQFNTNWLLGVETDFQGAGLHGRSIISPVPLSPTAGGGFALNSSAFMNRELNWFGTVRGRLGLTFDRLLIYGTGGFAYGQVKESADNTFFASTILNPGFQANFPASISNTKTGWTAGGGVEYALPANWTIRGEYLFVNLSGDSVAGLPTPAVFLPPPTNFQYTWNRTEFHVARFAVNYKF
jgi:outer membrane immunogenic protein